MTNKTRKFRVTIRVEEMIPMKDALPRVIRVSNVYKDLAVHSAELTSIGLLIGMAFTDLTQMVQRGVHNYLTRHLR